MPPDSAKLAEHIITRCRELGFALAGIAPAAPSSWGAELERWLAQGRHGSMRWLAQHTGERIDVRAFVPGARSMVMVADQYGARRSDGGQPLPDVDEPGTDGGRIRGRIARYAHADDYHEVMKRRLHTLCDELRAQHPGHTFRAFVDTAPVLEREHAVRAGLGWFAKHTLLIHPRRGSYLLLGGVVTSLRLDPPRDQRPIPDHCGTCTRCIDACPTDAITPYGVDATRCISYLTIERRSAIPEDFHEPIGEWLFGCDVCQEVCPHNSAPGQTIPVGRVNEAYAPKRSSFDLLEVLGWTPDDRRRALKGSALKRATLAMFKRNALIVGGNALRTRDEPALRARIAEIARDGSEDEMVRETARAVLRSLARESD